MVRKSFFNNCLTTFRLLPSTERPRALRHAAYSVILALLEVISISLILPLLYTLASDKVPLKDSVKFLSKLQSVEWPIALIILVFVFILKNTVATIIGHRQISYLNELYLYYSQKTFEGYYNTGWAEHLKDNSANAFQQIKITTWDFTHNVLNGVLTLIADVIIAISMSVILIWFDPRILLFFIILAVPMISFYYIFRKKVISKIDKSFRDATPKANLVLTQGISSYLEAKIYNKKDYFINQFIDAIAISNRSLANLKSFSNLPVRIFEILGILAFAGVILYAKTTPMPKDQLTIVFGLLAISLYKMVPAFSKILLSLSQIQSFSYSIQQLKSNLDISSSAEAEAGQAINFDHCLRLENVTFGYLANGVSVLHNVNLVIEKGDFVLLEGPSGCGKTTLLNLLAGLVDSYEGKIVIDETPLTHGCLMSWHSQLAIVAQSPVVLQDTFEHNIAFGQSEGLDLVRLKAAIEIAGLTQLVETLPGGLKTFIGENGLTLSGGQRQRLVLARALYRQPKVLLLDEVTNQLDYQNKISVLSALKDLTKSGVTIIMASHDTVAAEFSTKVFQFANGRVFPKTEKASAYKSA